MCSVDVHKHYIYIDRDDLADRELTPVEKLTCDYGQDSI